MYLCHYYYTSRNCDIPVYCFISHCLKISCRHHDSLPLNVSACICYRGIIESRQYDVWHNNMTESAFKRQSLGQCGSSRRHSVRSGIRSTVSVAFGRDMSGVSVTRVPTRWPCASWRCCPVGQVPPLCSGRFLFVVTIFDIGEVTLGIFFEMSERCQSRHRRRQGRWGSVFGLQWNTFPWCICFGRLGDVDRGIV